MAVTKTGADSQLAILKQRLQETFGTPIQKSVDCEHLSRQVALVTRENISAQTLRRIFGFIKSPFKPSLTNLNLLSRYCGYRDFDDLVNTHSGNKFEQMTASDEAAFYLRFFQIDVKAESDSNYHNACRNIAHRVLQNPGLFNRLAAPLAELKASRIFFYERFPYLDGLGSFYPRGVRLYLAHQKDDEAQVFGTALLLLSAVLTGREQEALQHCEHLTKLPLKKEYHPFVIGRYLGSIILCKHWLGEDVASEIDKVNKYAKYFSTSTRIGFWNFPYYQFMIMSYLNLSGLYELSCSVLRTISSHSYDFYNIEDGYLEGWTIIQEEAKHIENDKSFLRWFQRFDRWHEVNFIFKKYSRMRALSTYIQVCQQSGVNFKKEAEELERLIQTTGFSYFEKALAN